MSVINWRSAAKAVDENRTQPASASPYDALAGAAQRVDAANSALKRAQEQLVSAEREYDAARMALASHMPSYGVDALVDGRRPSGGADAE